MDPSIMKLLEEDEDESMHSGADVEAFTAALNRDIESGTSGAHSSKQETSFSQQGNQSSSQMYSQWPNSNQNDNNANPSQLNRDQIEGQPSSKVEFREPNSSIETKQDVNTSQAPSGAHMQYMSAEVNGQGQKVEQNSGQYSQPLSSTQMQISGRSHPQIPEQDMTHNPGSASQPSNMQRLNNQPVPVQEQAGASTQRQKQIPFGSLLPIILPELDKDRAMQLQTLYTKLRKNEIPKDGFVRHMRSIVGDQMLRLAVVKMQAKSQNTSQQQQRPPPGSAAQFSDPYSFGSPRVGGPPRGPSMPMQPHRDSAHQVVDNNSLNSHGMQANQIPGRPAISVQGLLKQQQEHLHFSQNSFPVYGGQSFAGQTVQFHQGFGQNSYNDTKSTPGPTIPNTSNSVSTRMDADTQVGAQSTKKAIIGQKKPFEALASSPPLPIKKQKVSGAFADQSIEHLIDVTAVSGVNLREEEEQLFCTPKDDSRVSEASRKAVQEEEDRVILQKIPLQKKLAEIMTKCGLKNLGNDVERCLSLCVDERLRALISNLIRVSKQRVDSEQSKHSTVVTSDVREQILMINQKAREEWEKKQAEADKLRKQNEPDDSALVDIEKEKDEARNKSLKVNKEEDDKMRTTAANVAARAAVGGDDMLSKWQLMAQARQKRDGPENGSSSQVGKDANPKQVAASTGNVRNTRGVGRKDMSTSLVTPGGVRQDGRSQVSTPPPRVAPSISVKDVIAVLEREPQMAKSTLVYQLYDRLHFDAPTE